MTNNSEAVDDSIETVKELNKEKQEKQKQVKKELEEQQGQQTEQPEDALQKRTSKIQKVVSNNNHQIALYLGH